VSVVDAVPVDAVIVASADCSDRARAEAALASSLAVARAPRRAAATSMRGHWRLEVKITAVSSGIRVADALIRADDGSRVAERSLSDRTSGICVPLVRAVSAWAQIVLDDELVRAHEMAEAPLAPPSPPPRPASPPPGQVTSSHPAGGGTSGPRPSTGGGRSTATSPIGESPSPSPVGEERAPAPARGRSELPTDDAAEQPAPTVAKEGDTFDLGVMLFLRNRGPGNSGIVGASPFVTVGLSRFWLLRPSLALGGSSRDADDSRPGVTYLGGRVDLCRRVPGNYIDRRGIEFDACAGTDAAWVSVKGAADGLLASVGPSAILRGEISNFGLEIRGMVGASMAQNTAPNVPFFVASGELGGSMRFR
jgi:hypothetical protein